MAINNIPLSLSCNWAAVKYSGTKVIQVRRDERKERRERGETWERDRVRGGQRERLGERGGACLASFFFSAAFRCVPQGLVFTKRLFRAAAPASYHRGYLR